MNRKHHMIKIENLLNHIRPYNCWTDLDFALSKDDILFIAGKNGGEITNTSFSMYDNRTKEDIYWDHVKKVAYFLVNDIEKAISINVGVPSIGFVPKYIIFDGNHRLLATIIKNYKYIKADVYGSEAHAKRLGIWNILD